MSEAVVRRWVETWRRAGEALDAQRRREIESLTDHDARRAVAELFALPAPADLPPRDDSGLVLQQRLFSRLRRRA
ncbi:MAG: hypothetical protein M0015_08565 [Betaproteobacteria bacterium]|nr:hypothetical protein [Betaproteobacteria bacterium]